MNKLGAITGIAALAAFAGCVNNGYVKNHPRNKDANRDTQPQQYEEPAAPRDVRPVQPPPPPPPQVSVAEQPRVIIDATPAPQPAKPDAAPQPVKPATTRYIVQRGDTLSKISKRYNIKIAAIKAANPQIKGEKIIIGQKLELPGNVEIGAQKAAPEAAPAPQAAAAPLKAASREFKPYTGPTKEYTVKSGDTLGGIAYGNGISVRQLRALNGDLKGDTIRVGKKLTIPAQKVEKKAAEKKPAAPAETKKAETANKPVEKKAEEPKDSANDAAQPEETAAQPAPEPVAAPAPAAEEEFYIYTVQEGDDLIGLSFEDDMPATELAKLNNLQKDAELKPGMKIKRRVKKENK